jgi:hypothetical protein
MRGLNKRGVGVDAEVVANDACLGHPAEPINVVQSERRR